MMLILKNAQTELKGTNTPSKNAFKGVLKLLRLPYWLMTGGLSLLTLVALQHKTLDPQTLLLTFFSMAFIGSAGFSVNDFFDRKSDALVKPNRPIPSGEISPKTAVSVSVFFFLLGLLQAFLLNWLCFLVVFIDSVLLVVYSAYIKRKSGFLSNLLVGGLIGTTFLYGEAAGFEAITYASLTMYPIALGSIGGNILRDILSLEGDSKTGYPTLPQRLGIEKSVRAATFFFIGCAVLSPLPYFFHVFGEKYLAFMLIWSFLLFYCSIRLLKSSFSQNDIRKTERIMTMSMILLPLALIIEVIA
ncbi:MAG: UbiA family prenyltransferase [Candidatus Bathyarchaeia archaeon]|jgi:geranylgeranylglycerol-phosphate geranylgeranyltransferase|nr:UbiA family prenyltransferase [Candidatus Bathyarchaeota archaeon A05DMB-3]